MPVNCDPSAQRQIQKLVTRTPSWLVQVIREEARKQHRGLSGQVSWILEQWALDLEELRKDKEHVGV